MALRAILWDRRAVIAAIDSTGFSTTLRGEWLRDCWHKHRGFVKAHAAVDVKTLEVLVIIVTDNRVSDGRAFKELVEQLHARGTTSSGRWPTAPTV